jgi:predicted ABC-type transport system involved in lysophospholipase L1 biosynthesis ATPase subunit
MLSRPLKGLGKLQQEAKAHLGGMEVVFVFPSFHIYMKYL